MHAAFASAGSAESTSYDENWEHVSRKGKSNVTRGQEDVQGGRTLTSQIFGGTLQSTVKAARAKASVTVQPFNLLHLDINSSNNVTAALQMLTKAEDIHGGFHAGIAVNAGSLQQSACLVAQCNAFSVCGNVLMCYAVLTSML